MLVYKYVFEFQNIRIGGGNPNLMTLAKYKGGKETRKPSK